MSVSAAPGAEPGAGRGEPRLDIPAPAPMGESCPLCGAPLHAEQDWCLRCGAAARTRLAASPNWKAPLAAFAVVLALSLGVLAAALVKLAGGSGTTPAPITTTVTTAPAAITTTPTATVPTTTVPRTTTPTATTRAPGGALGALGAITRHRLPGITSIPPSRTSTGALPSTGHVHLSPAVEKLLQKLHQERHQHP